VNIHPRRDIASGHTYWLDYNASAEVILTEVAATIPLSFIDDVIDCNYEIDPVYKITITVERM
jgi:hypothetical protein